MDGALAAPWILSRQRDTPYRQADYDAQPSSLAFFAPGLVDMVARRPHSQERGVIMGHRAYGCARGRDISARLVPRARA